MPISDKDFDEFVMSVVGDGDPFEIPQEIEKRLAGWKSAIDELYQTVEDFLAGQVSKGTIRVSYENIDLSEKYIGSYSAPRMLIEIGTRHVRLIPVGTVVIGGRGRVDVRGEIGQSRLVLIDKDATSPKDLIHVSIREDGRVATREAKAKEYAWRITTSPPQVQFLELTKGNFLEMLLEVSDA